MIRPESDWDDVDRAVNSFFHDSPLPQGWTVLSGDSLTKVVEYENERELKRAKRMDSSKPEKSLPDMPEAEPGTSLDLVFDEP